MVRFLVDCPIIITIISSNTFILIFISCNQYNKNTNIPDDKSAVNIFTVVNDNLKEQLKTIVTSPIEKGDLEPFRNIKKLFKACMNKSKSNASILLI
jgi:predicted metalloendopeptidase